MDNQIPTNSIAILHTNDFHNRLSSDQAQHLSAIYPAQGPARMLLDAGDAVGSGNITFKRKGEPILEAMSAIGYDAMTVGNRDFHFSDTGFRCKTMLASFPVLCANLRPKPPWLLNHEMPVADHVLVERGGWRVLVVGVTVPMITEKMAARHFSPFVFDDPIKTMQASIHSYKAKYRPDLMVALTHIGLQQDRKLARDVPELNLIIGGHSHDLLPEGEWVDRVLIVQAGCWAKYVGRVIGSKSETADGRPHLTATVEVL